jgi:hypothetical protein
LKVYKCEEGFLLKNVFCVFLLVILLSGCGRSVNFSVYNTKPPEETVKALFEKATNTIKDYVAEEPLCILDRDFDNKAFEESAEGVHKPYECKIISNCTYKKPC